MKILTQFHVLYYNLIKFLQMFLGFLENNWKICSTIFIFLCVWALTVPYILYLSTYVLIFIMGWGGCIYTILCVALCYMRSCIRDQFYRIFQSSTHNSLQFSTYLDKPSAILLFLIGRLNFEQSVRRFILKILFFSLKIKFCVCSSFLNLFYETGNK